MVAVARLVAHAVVSATGTIAAIEGFGLKEEERGMDDEDGMVPHKYASLVKDFHPKASYGQMHTFAEEEDVDYSVVTL